MLEGIVAIDRRTGAIGFKNGNLLLNDKRDKKFFVKETKKKILIVGRKTYNTLPKSVLEDPDRKVVKVTRKNLISIKDLIEENSNCILIGGAQTYKTFEEYITKWNITWFYSEGVEKEDKELVKFKPKLDNFKLIKTDYMKGLEICKFVKK